MRVRPTRKASEKFKLRTSVMVEEYFPTLADLQRVTEYWSGVLRLMKRRKPTKIERVYDTLAKDTLRELHRRLHARGPIQRQVVTDGFIRWLVLDRKRPRRYARKDPRLLTEFVRYARPHLKRKGAPKT